MGSAALTVMCASSGVAHAETYHVDPAGSDSATGSATAPFATLQHAASVVHAGDEVRVHAGRYAGFHLTTSGTSASPIVFRADPGVIVDRENPRTPHGINLEGASHVVIEGFAVENAPRVGIRTVLSTGVVIRNNRVSGSGLTGILTGYAYDLVIEGNVSSGAIEEHGIYVSNSDRENDNVVVHGNESFENGTNGIQFNGDCDDAAGILDGNVISGNYVHDNDQKGLSLISFQSSRVENNVIVDNGYEAGAGGIHLADEIGCGLPSNDNVVVNNTIIEPRITGIRITQGSARNVIFDNLVVSGRGGSYIVVDEVGLSFIDEVSNVVSADVGELLAAPLDADYRPRTGSALVDRGVSTFMGAYAPSVDRDGVARPQGAGHDIGAHEACEDPCAVGPHDAGKPGELDGGRSEDGGVGTLERDGASEPPGDAGASAEAPAGCGCTVASETRSAPWWLVLLGLPLLRVVRGRSDILAR